MAITGKFVSLAVCCVLLLPTRLTVSAKKSSAYLIEEISEYKDLKKIWKTNTNVMVIYCRTEKSVPKSTMAVLVQVAQEMKGLAKLILVDCSDAKKLCKKVKTSPSSFELKHYKDGEFNRDYERKHTVKSLMNFLNDPTGDSPWEEDSTASDVVHIDTEQEFSKLLRTKKQPVLSMFYAPWCGFCKKIKPDFAAAATELKGHSILAGVDVDKPHMMSLRAQFNITGFPTIIYFEGGKEKFHFGGERNKEGIVSWMRNPKAPEPEKTEESWADADNDVVHLTDDTFDSYMKENPSVLVMFYAPWCGHCKKMKPEYDEAATTMKDEEISGALAAIDVTENKKLGERFDIKGFPTVKYFKNGEVEFDVNERTASKIVEFMKDPKEPPAPPPAEPAWSEVESDVVHLTEENFKPTLKKKKHSLVMFYAPWCGHCKAAKPHFMQAAAKYKEENKVMFAAVDCTTHQSVCQTYDVSGYPTFLYFNYGRDEEKYTGGREEADFVHFMKDPQNPASMKPPTPPPEEAWSGLEGAELVNHLTDSSFEDFMATHGSVLVMFYAPWCGHCKAMKPAYAEAALILDTEKVDGVLAAVDATVEQQVASQYGVRGYPTIKYFKNGKEEFDYNKGRQTKDIVNFMKNPTEAVEPPKPKEPGWSDEPSAVNHLTSENFDTFQSSRDHLLVMFYAPWCGHCKRAKPEFTEAANELAGDSSSALAAVDCTVDKDLCSKYGVSGYPTFKYFSKGLPPRDYDSGRSKADFIGFLKKQSTAKQEL